MNVQEEKPPSQANQNSVKLCFSRSGDLRRLIVRCQPLLAGVGGFRSLVVLGSGRRNSVLEVGRKNK